MKNILLVTGIFTLLLLSCPQPTDSSKDPINTIDDDTNTTTIVFDNTQGICTAVVYDDYRREAVYKIAEIRAGGLSNPIPWQPSNSCSFYFSYIFAVDGVDDLSITYIPDPGRDQNAVRIDADTRNNIPIPGITETLSATDTLLSRDCYIEIQNESSYSFQLCRSNSPIPPDKTTAALVNAGERALYTISPGGASLYTLLSGSVPRNFTGTEAVFEAGHIYRFSFDGTSAEQTEVIPVTLDRVRAPTPDIPNVPTTGAGLYKGATLAGAVKVGNQNLEDALNYISANAQTGDNYFIVLGTDALIDPQWLDHYGGYGQTVGITLMADGVERTVQLASNGSLFTVDSGVTLTLENNVTLTGRTTNTASLISVYSGGTFIMNGGKISGNTVSSSYSYGGGVYVDSGTFTMSGGEISGNTVSSSSSYSYGGGVSVSSGTFTMSGGKISGNTVSSYSYSYGGGVSISGGTFTMSGGEISGNTASSSYSSYYYYSYGGGVSVSGGTFTKSGTGGIITGYGNNTVNGNKVIRNGSVLSGYGHAVYVSSSQRLENTVPANKALDSRVYSVAGGWTE